MAAQWCGDNLMEKRASTAAAAGQYTMNVQNGGGKEACITSYNSTSLRGRISKCVSRHSFLIPVVCVCYFQISLTGNEEESE
jgi:hypothetical protein